MCLCRDSSGAEQKPEELCVGGSIPSPGTICFSRTSLVLDVRVHQLIFSGFRVFSFLSEKLSSIVSLFGSKKKITREDSDQFLSGVKTTLLDADVSLAVVDRFMQALSVEMQGLTIPSGLSLADVLTQKLYTQVVSFLGDRRQEGDVFKALCNGSGMSRIMVLGLQGSGKTTSVAKLAAWISEVAGATQKPKKIAIGSVDLYRPAAREQLAVLAQRAQVLFCHGVQGTLEQMVASQVDEARQAGCDVFILDTAGRMHLNDVLMQEIERTRDVFSPTHSLWVVDGMTGQESVAIGSSFLKNVGFDSVILTKLDGGARGGVAFGLSYELSKPIYFMGTGEGVGDIEIFEPERVASRIVGLGDVKGLLDRFDKALKREAELDAAAVTRRMMSGQLTLQDFAQQLTLVGSMGSMGKLLQYLPGAPKISSEELGRKERELKKFKAILSSMTNGERSGRSLLTGARKMRIAKGAGVFVKDIDELLSKFEETKQFARMIKKMGGFGSLFK